MSTINMTFQVPDSKKIDVEALKLQMQGYLDFILSMPSIIKPESAVQEEGWEASPELLERLEKSRQEIREGKGVRCKSRKELEAFLESL